LGSGNRSIGASVAGAKHDAKERRLCHSFFALDGKAPNKRSKQ